MSDVDELRELNQLLEEKVIERTVLLTRAKRTWQATFDAFVDPLAIVDSDMRIVRTNLAFAGHSGADVRDVNGRKCHSVLFGNDTICRGCPVPQTLATAKVAEGEIIDKPRGRTFRMWAVPMNSDADESGYDIGPPDQAVCHYKDVTDEKQLIRRIIQTEKMAAVGTLAGGVAHEINNPLGAILAFTQLALLESPQDSNLHEFLQEIESSAERCKRIVAGLLGFSRKSHGERRAVDVNEIVERAVFLCRSEYTKRGITVTPDFADDLPRLIADGNQIQQVLINLISNAAHAIGKGGEIVIGTSANHGEEVRISVRDDGPGIAAADIEKLFEPFFTTKPEGQGTGLGLAVSYGIIVDHGGVIEVSSTVGEGAAFEVVLPWPKEESGESNE